MNIQFILYVADQEKSKDFYEKILGTAPTLHVPGMTEFTLADNCKIGLMPNNGIAKIISHKTPHPSKGTGIPRCELYLEVENPKRQLQIAIDAGAKLISQIADRNWGHQAGYCADQDGHVIAFAKEIG